MTRIAFYFQREENKYKYKRKMKTGFSLENDGLIWNPVCANWNEPISTFNHKKQTEVRFGAGFMWWYSPVF